MAIILLSFGAVPAVGAPADPVPDAWYSDLPGYAPGEVPAGPWKAYTYLDASDLKIYADQDPPAQAVLNALKGKQSYASGTKERMFASWKEKLKKKPGSTNAAQMKGRWEEFVEDYIDGVDSDRRGDSFEKFSADELGITGSADYEFDQKSPHGAVRPDVFPLKPELARMFEFKDVTSFSDRAKAQLNAYVAVVDATGKQLSCSSGRSR